MKKINFLLIFCILSFSCNNEKVKGLETRVSRLEKENIKLKDSLKKLTYNMLISSQLIGIPEENNLKINQKNKFKFFFYQEQKLPAYDIFEIDNKGEKKLLLKDYKKSDFYYDFIPKSNEDKSFKIKTLFYLDTVAIEIPGVINMK
ncbi:hypothetical protein [Tenacibaculum sp. SDUM215027]|uniref:hypothetical protein n=1 Tax=Tenacibaculum sp. SDUM215027 TaxID=3422596 RepID=UPI003D3222B4